MRKMLHSFAPRDQDENSQDRAGVCLDNFGQKDDDVIIEEPPFDYS